MSKAQAKGKKQLPESDESEEEEELVTKKQKANNGAGKTSAKAQTPKKPVESDDDSEEEAPKAKPSKIAAKANNKSNGKKAADSDEESEDEAPKKATPKSAAKAAPAKNGKKPVDEDEEEEEEVTSKVQVKTPVQAAKSEGPFEIIVKGLAFSISDHDIREYFQECGAIERVNLLKGPDGRSKGIAFLTFDSADAVNTALGYSGSDFNGRSITIEKTTPKELRTPTPAREFPKSERDPTSSSIFVGNLSYDTTEESLSAFFESCGKVTGARIAYGQDGNPRGFAHVDFASPDSVEKAVAKSGSKVDGRAIRVDYSSSKKQDSGNRGGNRGGYGDRGFGSGGKRGGYGNKQRY